MVQAPSLFFTSFSNSSKLAAYLSPLMLKLSTNLVLLSHILVLPSFLTQIPVTCLCGAILSASSASACALSQAPIASASASSCACICFTNSSGRESMIPSTKSMASSTTSSVPSLTLISSFSVESATLSNSSLASSYSSYCFLVRASQPNSAAASRAAAVHSPLFTASSTRVSAAFKYCLKLVSS